MGSKSEKKEEKSLNVQRFYLITTQVSLRSSKQKRDKDGTSFYEMQNIWLSYSKALQVSEETERSSHLVGSEVLFCLMLWASIV